MSDEAPQQASLRLDKWLWYARFFKTRSLASRVCESGKVRLAGTPVSKTHQKIKCGDVLTFRQGEHIRVVRVLALGTRRGPAGEAQALYEDLAPPDRENRLPKNTPPPVAQRKAGEGRPTKRDRRAMLRFKQKARTAGND
ncbi:MAG TPA: RNA-binding S4 domain-containing protein [Kiloniellaceae bacterium]|nr:RNA-binding S4 domain-containing protein [Kiloniellaceae bacterium]